ncbi:MAG: NAD(P)H-hydrate epimerase [Cyanobacteria bacterium P01_F01_bin.4]
METQGTATLIFFSDLPTTLTLDCHYIDKGMTPGLTMIQKFLTDTDIVVPAITTAQMVEVDRVAIEETGPNLFQMMENAGLHLACQAIDLLGDTWQQVPIVVLAGTGGIGGGGMCAARHLANRGAQVKLCLTSPERLREVPKWQFYIFQSTPGQTVSMDDLSTLDQPLGLIIDALIGYSLQAAPRGAARDLIQWANAEPAPILSLDVPSGVDSTTGETPGVHMRPRQTLTLALPKTGLLPTKTGDLWLADLGIPAGTYRWETLKIEYQSPFEMCDRIHLNPSF